MDVSDAGSFQSRHRCSQNRDRNPKGGGTGFTRGMQTSQQPAKPGSIISLERNDFSVTPWVFYLCIFFQCAAKDISGIKTHIQQNKKKSTRFHKLKSYTAIKPINTFKQEENCSSSQFSSFALHTDN